MKGECKGLETSWFSSSQRQNSCGWVAKLWSLWNYKIKKRFEPAGLSPENNFSYQPETCKTGHEPGPKLDRLAWLQKNFRSKSWIDSRLSVNSTQHWGGSFDGDLVKNRIEPTENGRKFRPTLLEARCGVSAKSTADLKIEWKGKRFEYSSNEESTRVGRG